MQCSVYCVLCSAVCIVYCVVQCVQFSVAVLCVEAGQVGSPGSTHLAGPPHYTLYTVQCVVWSVECGVCSV